MHCKAFLVCKSTCFTTAMSNPFAACGEWPFKRGEYPFKRCEWLALQIWHVFHRLGCTFMVPFMSYNMPNKMLFKNIEHRCFITIL